MPFRFSPRLPYALVPLVIAALMAPPHVAVADTPPSDGPTAMAPIDVAAAEAKAAAEDKLGAQFDALLKDTGALGAFHDDLGNLVVDVPSSGSSSFTVAAADALGIQVVLRPVDIEPSEIKAIQDMVATVKWTPAPDAFYPYASFNPRSGKVRLYSDAPVSAFQNIFGLYPGKIVYAGRGLTFANDSCADWEGTRGHFGGAAMKLRAINNAGGQCFSHTNWLYHCTSGFGVFNSNHNDRMITAAHCFPDDYYVDSPGGDTFGCVRRRDGWTTDTSRLLDCCDSSSTLYDFELIGSNSIKQGHYIYTGSPVSNYPVLPVVSSGSPSSLPRYCFMGTTSFEHCNLDFVSYGSISSPSGASYYWFELDGPLAGDGVCHGDSGGPIYRKFTDTQTVQIVGMINAGDRYSTSDEDIQLCKTETQRTFGTNWTTIQTVYGVTLKTVSNDP
jgi:hypothetical protein